MKDSSPSFDSTGSGATDDEELRGETSSGQPAATLSQNLLRLGKMTAFYVPSHKLDDPRFFHGTQTARSLIHEFLMHRYRAYTQTPTPMKGFWIDQRRQLVHDVMERFEVSFGNEQEFDRLVEFLIELCERLEEDAVYVTRGECSYLVTRRKIEPPASE